MWKHFVILGLITEVLACNQFAIAGGVSEVAGGRARKFNLDQAILTALERNPDILKAKQEIERSKGVVIEVRAQALPHITPNAELQWRDPNLRGGASFSTTGGTGGGIGGGTGGTGGGTLGNFQQSDISYAIRVTGTQLIFNGTTLPAIRGTFFQRDSAYCGFRNILDQVIATVKTQFYQVVVDKALIGVQEEQVQLLQSQLKDQQNRFEAGTVPRFNVLQAEVALYNQLPQLITARNNFRIAQLTLAKTLG